MRNLLQLSQAPGRHRDETKLCLQNLKNLCNCWELQNDLLQSLEDLPPGPVGARVADPCTHHLHIPYQKGSHTGFILTEQPLGT